MGLKEEILGLAADFSGCQPDKIDPADVLGSCGMEGDGADEFIMELSERHSINLDEFIPYFHYDGDEPPGFLFALRAIDREGNIIPYIPISVDDLAKAANTGAFAFAYPHHSARRVFHGSLTAVVIYLGLIAGVAFLAVAAIYFFGGNGACP